MDISNMVTAMLVAFVSISLVVSSIMIGIITYISLVLERKKEIGMPTLQWREQAQHLQVFNAETVIEFVAGAMGILITLALLIP